MLHVEGVISLFVSLVDKIVFFLVVNSFVTNLNHSSYTGYKKKITSYKWDKGSKINCLQNKQNWKKFS